MNATEYPASTRSESTSEKVQGNLSHEPVETENPYKSDDDVDVQGNLSHDLSEWLQEFKENLVDASVPEHRDASCSSHESPSEPRAKSGTKSGQSYGFKTHFPKDPNCDICLRTKITLASCRKRIGTAVPRAENVGDLITTGH